MWQLWTASGHQSKQCQTNFKAAVKANNVKRNKPQACSVFETFQRLSKPFVVFLITLVVWVTKTVKVVPVVWWKLAESMAFWNITNTTFRFWVKCRCSVRWTYYRPDWQSLKQSFHLSEHNTMNLVPAWKSFERVSHYFSMSSSLIELQMCDTSRDVGPENFSIVGLPFESTKTLQPKWMYPTVLSCRDNSRQISFWSKRIWWLNLIHALTCQKRVRLSNW